MRDLFFCISPRLAPPQTNGLRNVGKPHEECTMKLRTYSFIMWLGTTALFFQSNSSVNAQAQARAAATNGETPAPSTVTRDRVNGLDRITGNVKVLNAHLLVFDDGTEVDLNGGIDAPELDQKGRINGAFYPCGREAAEFLLK